MSFLLEHCIFSELTPELISKSNPFNCSKDTDINAFFHKDYNEYSKQLLGKSYCFFTDESPHEIVCAFTVSNSSIRVRGLSNNRKRKLHKHIPNEIRHSQYPAVLVGQLVVFDKFKNKHIGNELMDFIKAWFIEPLNKTGCRFVIVDAINHPKVRKYYTDNGFDFIFATDEEEMNFMNNTLKNDNWIQKMLNFFCPKSKIEERRTRLMYFDLILLYSE